MSRPSETPQKNVGKSCGSRSPDVDIVRLFLVKMCGGIGRAMIARPDQTQLDLFSV